MINVIPGIIALSPRVVCFCGGEPLLRYNVLPQLAQQLSEAGITVNMVTNGFLLDDEKIKTLRSSGISGFQISLDSAHEETHDYFRGFKGAYAGATRAIDLLLKRSIMPDVTFIPTRINYKDIGEVVEYLYFRGIRRLGSMPFIPIGRGKENYDELTLLDEELLDFYYTLERLRMMYPDFKIEYEDPLEHITLFLNNTVARNAVIEIRSNGDVMVSSYLPITYGNVRYHRIDTLWDSGLKEIWRDEHVRSIAEKIKTVDDFTELHIQPWNQEDVDVFHSSKMIVKTKEAN
jgi:MoaA/NifB/PqqE/SkfB family radical SAM enzyme